MKKIVSIVLVVILLFSFSACGFSSTDSVVFYPELVKYNLERGQTDTNEFSFNIQLLSSKAKPEIEFIYAEGENTDNLSVTFTDDTFDDLKRKIDGKYMILLGVYCKPVSDYIRIDSMILKVDGKKTKLDFPVPVENRFYDFDSRDHFIAQMNMPTYVFTTSFLGQNETDYIFAMQVLSDLTVRKAAFDDFISFANATVLVNGDEIGALSDVLPLKLKSEDVLSIKSKIKLNGSDELFMGNIYTSLVIDYSAGGKKLQERFHLSAAYLGNRNDAKAFVKAFNG